MASGDRLQGLQLKLLREKQAAAGMEREAASEGLASVSLCLAKLEKVSTKVRARDVLAAVQLELEGSAGLVVTNMLGSMPRLAKPLGWQWQMPSDHLPVGAVICVVGRKLRAVSYNVLNKRYYKYIQSDSQGLQGSLISTLHGTPDEGAEGEEGDALADGRERRVAELVFAMLHPPPLPHFERVHLLGLQECSPDFLRILKKRLNKHGRYEVLQSGEEEDANQEAPRDPLRESEIPLSSEILRMSVTSLWKNLERPAPEIFELCLRFKGCGLRPRVSHLGGADLPPRPRSLHDGRCQEGQGLRQIAVGDLGGRGWEDARLSR